jgi:SAM-dependent methyltransferase
MVANVCDGGIVLVLPARRMAVEPRCPIAAHGPARIVLDVLVRGGVESSWGVRTDRATVYECPGCGLRFRLPPEKAEVESFYGAQYHDRMGGGVGDQQRETVHRLENEERIKYLKRFRDRGRVLDVGCSLGHFAKQLETAGFDSMGCDISPYACERSENLLGAGRVLRGSVEGFADGLEASFDAVTMMDVIEHFLDVVTPLQAIRRMLKPGGVLFLRTPTLSSPFYRVAEVAHRLSAGLYKTALLKLYHAEHVYFFGESSVTVLLEHLGFRVEEVAPDPLLWDNFRSAELRHGRLNNTALTLIYFAGRALNRGHGMRVVARRPM